MNTIFRYQFFVIKEIKKAVKNRNIYYNIFDNKTKKLFIDRVNSLSNILNFLLDYIKQEIHSTQIVSIYVYGSYLYGNSDYIPNDIDIGVVVKGNIFKYIIDKIVLPSCLYKKLIVPTKNISLFVYGEDNMVRGIPINDTVFAGLIHKQTIKRELSIAYWRNIVIWGTDFKYINNNEKNTFVTLARMINGCRERLLRYGHNNREDERTLFRKVATRLVEANVFMEFFSPGLLINWNELLKFPLRVTRSSVYYEEIKKLYEVTVSTYSKIEKNVIKN